MKPLIDLNCSAIECTSLSPSAPIWQDVLAQAMTGELVAAMNYTSLSEICDDPGEVADALEHAEGERGHAAAFAAEGRKIGVDVPSNVDAKHWKRLRGAFLAPLRNGLTARNDRSTVPVRWSRRSKADGCVRPRARHPRLVGRRDPGCGHGVGRRERPEGVA